MIRYFVVEISNYDEVVLLLFFQQKLLILNICIIQHISLTEKEVINLIIEPRKHSTHNL